MSHDQRSAPRRDRIFNVETCRALRRTGRDAGRIVAVGLTFILAFIAVFASSALSAPPLSDFVLTIAMAVVGAVATTAVMWWVNLIPTHETLRQSKHMAIETVAQMLSREHELPTEYQPVTDADGQPDPQPVPALAAGRAPIDWAFIIAIPVGAVRVISTSPIEVSTSVLLVGGLALGAAMFWVTDDLTDTYPPENPPHEQSRERMSPNKGERKSE